MRQEGLDFQRRERDACGIGAVVNIDGSREYGVLDDALSIVEKLEHRAGKDAAGKVGDGVGILTQLPHGLFRGLFAAEGLAFPAPGRYAAGMIFFPAELRARTFAKRMFEVIAEKNGLPLLFWRDVPVRPEILGETALACMPVIVQCFLQIPEGTEEGLPFERKLYLLRKEFEQSSTDTYICSLSSRTIVYKGMFLVGQLRQFYEDLQQESYETAIALVHSRFSTNTTPSWERAHPYRLIAHNGEINTIRGNADRMLAREETMSSDFLAEDDCALKVYPVVNTAGSDSAMLDNTLEFLMMNGMDLAEAVMITIPEPWRNDRDMPLEKRDFYHYYATMMEPWDGPAAVIFSDGEILGATLDRNGLRPSRYYVTDRGRLVLASEVGVLPEDSRHIVKKSRLMPGRMLLVDTKKKRIISDEECKRYYAERRPFGEWLDRNLLRLKDLPVPNHRPPVNSQELRDKLYRAFGYTYEEVKEQLLPMAENAVEPTASMGHDVPLAVLSEKHQNLFDYFKQLFAQVTNPPIDSLREEIVTDTSVYLGSDGNLLKEESGNCRVLEVEQPVLTGVDMVRLRSLNKPGLVAKTVPILYYRSMDLGRALEQLLVSVDRAAAAGANIIILSDWGVDENHLAIPSLLAVSAVSRHLVRTKKRTAVSLVLESAEPRTVHHFACLMGFGARAIYPYLAHECIGELIEEEILDKDFHTAVSDYNRAVQKGIVKIAAKMGISTLQAYESARIFESVGLGKEVIDRWFTGAAADAYGIGIREIEEGVRFRHDHAFDPLGLGLDTTLDSIGFHRLRSGENKEDHLYNPLTITLLQQAVREGSYEKFKAYTAQVDNELPHTLRGLLTFVPAGEPIPLEEVEPVSEIVKRFKTGAMSYGSISEEAHKCMARAMNRLGGRSNTGEGGEDEARFGTETNSKIKQVASARFGVTSGYLMSAEEIQIKMAQGAKPGEGGHLPGAKVYPWVAKTRYSMPGVALISPPPHHDIYSIEDLAQLIYDLKNANRKARINVKLCSEAGVGTIASGVAKAGAQVILISGYDGGTGAAPYSSIHGAGLPWELGLSEAHQTLVKNGLRGRVALETDGKLMSGRDVVIAAMLGAEEYGFATAVLVSMGCMMMRVCTLDTCPVGIATQNERLRARFRGKPEHVMNFMRFVAEEMREIMESLGIRTVEEMVGRTDLLKPKEKQITRRAEMVQLDSLLGKEYAAAPERHFLPERVYDFGLEKTVDERVLLPWLEEVTGGSGSGEGSWEAEDECQAGAGEKTSRAGAGERTAYRIPAKQAEIAIEVSSTDRTVGTIFGSEVTARFGNSLPDDTFRVHVKGGCGQSFGAFLPKGVTLEVEGDANDGFGKGLSGGKLVLYPPKTAAFAASENVIAGNVALYGATSGTAYICGIAGERFCVRNSGATAVAEGCGDHGLEYMTGGRAVILGPTGKNFAAGMSGGTAYVLDPDHRLYRRMNAGMPPAEELTDRQDKEELKAILEDYRRETGSALAGRILGDFEHYAPQFKKIVPKEYQRVVSAVAKYELRGQSREEALMSAFREATGKV